LCASILPDKLHIDTADGDIPISALLTSASVHDSQVSLPLAKITQLRVDYLYELMDAAYDAKIIRDDSVSKGHVPLIDFNRRSSNDKREFAPHEARRYKERSSAERVNSNLKDNFGGRFVRVRGHAKVLSHLMFGLLALSIDQTIRLLL
jgi:Transposase DDE domain